MGARERRSSGRKESKKKPPLSAVEVDLASQRRDAVVMEQAPEVKAAEKPEQKRRCVDPMALWSKPQQRYASKEPPKQEAPKPKASGPRGGVAVGAVGEDGLLARLRRRKANLEHN